MFFDLVKRKFIPTCGLKLIDGYTLQCIDVCDQNRYIDKVENKCIDVCN